MAGKLSPEELAVIKQKYGARRAAAEERKKASRQERATTAKETKKKVSLDDINQKIAEQEAKSNAFKETLASGAELPSSIDTGFNQTSPTQVTDNKNYHHALASMVADLRNRISIVKTGVSSEATKKTVVNADRNGVPVDRYVDKSGRRRSFVEGSVLKKLTPAEVMLDKAEKHLQNSWQANLAGGADGALTAAESFTKAGDTLTAALNHLHENFGTSQKYKKVFTTGDFGDKSSPVNIDIGSKSQVTDIVNGHNDHVLGRATSTGIIPSEVTADIKSSKVLHRDYDTVIPVPAVTAAAGRYAPKTDEEKAADQAAKADLRAKRQETAAKEKANKGVSNIVIPSEDYPSEPATEEEIKGIRRTGTPAPHTLRWGRAQVQPVFEKNEQDAEESAAAVGKQYIKKTFIGSEAHTNPVAWHLRNQVRSHWLANTKGARPEDFESSEAHQDPLGYVAKHAGSAKPVPQNPLTFDTKKAARLTVFTPNAKSTAEKMIFKPLGEAEGEVRDTPKKVSFTPFHPTATETKNAEEENQVDVPEAVNKRQLSRASREGALLSRKNVSFDTAGFQTKDTEEEPTSEPGVYDPNPESATTKSVAEVEALKAVGRPVSLNVHFTDGAGK